MAIDDRPRQEKSAWEQSQLYELYNKRILSGNPDDLVVVIAPSSKTGVSGVGKTTFGLQLAKRMDQSTGGFNAEEKATLSSQELAHSIYPDMESKSAAIFDEAQGTMQSSGMDSRRGMAQDNIDALRAVVLNRNNNCALIIITQSTRWIDSRMMETIDALLLIQRKGMAKHYQYYRDDLNFQGSSEYTPSIEKLHWQPLPSDDEDYQALEQMKEKAKERGGGEDSEPSNPDEIKRQKKIEIAQNMREDGMTIAKIAEVVDMSEGWVTNNTESPE